MRYKGQYCHIFLKRKIKTEIKIILKHKVDHKNDKILLISLHKTEWIYIKSTKFHAY